VLKRLHYTVCKTVPGTKEHVKSWALWLLGARWPFVEVQERVAVASAGGCFGDAVVALWLVPH